MTRPLSAAAQTAAKDLSLNPWLQMCRDLANGSKHSVVTRKPLPKISDATASVGYGIGRYDLGVYGEGEWSITFKHEGTTHDALTLMQQALETWRTFFSRYG